MSINVHFTKSNKEKNMPFMTKKNFLKPLNSTVGTVKFVHIRRLSISTDTFSLLLSLTGIIDPELRTKTIPLPLILVIKPVPNKRFCKDPPNEADIEIGIFLSI